ncbi:MAG: ribosome assembly protein 4, partial [Pseudomonas sp.]|nr:ribosome assembly protein 4 [Pseudomonas sp.]
MAKIKVLAGDFLQGDAEYLAGTITLVTPLYPWPGVSLKQTDISHMEIASEAPTTRMENALGLGLAGALVLGPVGAAAGLMFAPEHKEVTFLATLKDGRKLLAA